MVQGMESVNPSENKPRAAGAAAQMTIVLAHARNPDIDGGYWDGAPDCPKKQIVAVGSLEEASRALTEWTGKHGLGGGNMARDCGKVMHGRKEIARISYNGRAWQPGVFPTPEIPINR